MKVFFNKFGQFLDLFKANGITNSIWEKVKIYTLTNSNIKCIIKNDKESYSNIAKWYHKISHKIRVPLDLNIEKGDVLKDKSWNSFNIIFIEEKICISPINSFKQVYASKL